MPKYLDREYLILKTDILRVRSLKIICPLLEKIMKLYIYQDISDISYIPRYSCIYIYLIDDIVCSIYRYKIIHLLLYRKISI